MARRISGRIVGGSVLAVVGVVLLLGLAGVWSYAGPGPKARDGEVTVVGLERGSGVRRISQTLEGAGVISSGLLFTIAARVTGAAADLKAGEYEVASGASMASVLSDIRAGKVVRHTVAIPEGWTSGMVVDALNAASELTGTVAEPPEGSVLPDTYEVQRGESREAVIERMTQARDKLLAELWAGREPGLPVATPEEAVILASIVEKETGVAAERTRVAGVFMNRLRMGMALGSDPTIIYGITKGRPLGRGIRQSELDALSPYNSYKVAGLPPTPIANPGRAALEAVMHPMKTPELYFVADGTGGHAFAATLAEHERNVIRWRAIEKQRAAK